MRYGFEVKFRFVGDRGECIKYIPHGRLLLGEVWAQDVELGGLDQAGRVRELDNGVRISVQANKTLPIITIDASRVVGGSPPSGLFTLRMAWIPEGIVLTPVNVDSPEGWGLPNRTAVATDETPSGTIINPPYEGIEPDELEALLASAETIMASPLGTEGGVLPQVLLNRYANNKYLDERDFISGVDQAVIQSIVPENPRRRLDNDTAFISAGMSFVTQWQSLYDTLNCVVPPEDDGTLYWAEAEIFLPQVPGIYTLSSITLNDEEVTSSVLLQPQFADNVYTSNIYEDESDRWYCHRPEELLYGIASYEGCFQETNRIRADAGRPPMYRQVRGHANAARMAVEEVALSNKMYHDSDDFRPGYTLMLGRGMNALMRGFNAENLLLATTFNIGTEESGREMAKLWEGSPPHHANQISTLWDNDSSFPGAEHHVAHMGGLIDDSLYTGPIDPPTAGDIGSQCFSKKEWWLPPSSHHHEGLYGVVGYFATQQDHSREEYDTAIPYVSYNGRIYYVEQFFGDVEFLGIFGAAVYKAIDPITSAEQMKLRIVVALADKDLLDETTGYITIKVLTKPVRVTQDYDCEWDEEFTYNFNNNEGWFPYAEPSFKFTQDGTKFLFSMLKTTHTYNEALDSDATDFESDISATVKPRKTVLVHFIEYRGVMEGFHIEPVYAPHVFINATTTDAGGANHENIYQRTINSSTPIFADYDADDEIQYVYAQVQEYSYQRWKKANIDPDPETESYGYRVRNLLFPSGKKVPYYQMYMQDSETVDDIGELSNYGWPGDWSKGSFVRRIEHLDVISEDVIFHHLQWHSVLDSSSAFFETVRHDGDQWLAIDLGFGEERHEEVLWSGPDRLWQYQQNLVLQGYAHTDSSNRPRTTHAYPMHVSVEDTKGIYCMDQAVMSLWAFADGTSYVYHRQVFPTPYGYFEDSGGVPDDTTIMYKGVTSMDSMYGRPPAHDFFASVAPGLSGFGGDNALPFWNPAVWGSMVYSANIAPIMADETNARCKIVRYKDRIVVRANTRRIPFAIPPTTQGTWAGVLAAYEDVPEELEVVIHTNFDLDEATGMSDVTDIFPFGRV